MANVSEGLDSSAASKSSQLEIREAQIVFDSVWTEIEAQYGPDKMSFPEEVFWLNGSPGAGKGTQTRFIMELRDITAPPIVVSSLLKSQEAQRLIDVGQMVSDREVTHLVLRKLIAPVYRNGAIIDGYPRTPIQVHCLKLLYQRLVERRHESINTPLADVYRKPIFHIIVLFVDEVASVQRQLKRGRAILKHNEQVDKSGMGQAIDMRKTDLSAETARKRYHTFKEVTYESLKTLQRVFQYHYIDANGSIEKVQERIVDELRYQSSLELDQPTYDRIAAIPIASQLVLHARQELVQRLIDYEHNHTKLFKQVVVLIKEVFIPVLRRHSISGLAYVSCANKLFDNVLARSMVIDIFSERGYHVAIENRSYEVPQSLDSQTNHIINTKKANYRFRIHFIGTEIRRGR